MMNEYDVAIIGAGAAGLMAALEIALTGRSVIIIEAKQKCGGRINTFYTSQNYPIELGAEFVHGKLPLTLDLLKKAKIEKIEVKGSIWQKKNRRLQQQEDFIEDFSELEKKFKELIKDIPVSRFISHHLKAKKFEELRFTLKNYVEGYYAANLTKASTEALCKELTESDDEQYRLEGGYEQVVNYLQQQCVEKGVAIHLSEEVKKINWKEDEVKIETAHNSFKASKVLVTVSIGVLQANSIKFLPALPLKIQAAKKLGYGHVQKINLEFATAFWRDENFTKGKDLSELNFLFSEETIPTWWTQHPKNVAVLSGWLGGPKAFALKELTSEKIVRKALQSLGHIFGLTLKQLKQNLVAAEFYNWSADKHFCGAYSFQVVDGEKYINELLQPLNNRVFFAGEGLHSGPEIGTVEAALVSGRDVSHRLIAALPAQFGKKSMV